MIALRRRGIENSGKKRGEMATREERAMIDWHEEEQGRMNQSIIILVSLT